MSRKQKAWEVLIGLAYASVCGSVVGLLVFTPLIAWGMLPEQWLVGPVFGLLLALVFVLAAMVVPD